MDNSIDLIHRIQDSYSSFTEPEQKILLQILNELSISGESETYEQVWLADYKEIPVSITTFLTDNDYLGLTNSQGKSVYPFWKETLQDIFAESNRYDEIVFTGATRIGKTSTAVTTAIYMLYKLMCLKDPQEFFGKKDVSKFYVLFFNVTKDLAKSISFREFNDTLKLSPWFNRHGTFSKSERDFYYIPEGGKVIIDFGSMGVHALGTQCYVAIMDECNFARSGIKDINKAKENMLDTYNTISTRIKGTFRKNGEVWGKMISVSSKKSDNDFLEQHIERQKSSGAGDHMYVVDKPQWEVLPQSMFNEKRFHIAVGDRYNKGFVIADNQSDEASLDDIRSQGYMILSPPYDMRPSFVADFDIALRDLAGISVPGALSYITQESLTACVDKTRRNPFYSDIISIGTKDNLTLEEFFHLEEVPNEVKRNPVFIHLDLSATGDRTGIGGVSITGRKDVSTDSQSTVSLPFFTHVFSIGLQAPRGDRVPYQKILEFILWLRKSGFNIKAVSRDQFQSEYMGQLLESKGIPSPRISLDRTPDGYMAFRSVVQEQRISLLDCELLQDELIHLQRDSITGKIDHTVGNSKDVSDGLVGAVWEAIIENPGQTVPTKKLVRAISAVNGVNASNSAVSLSTQFNNIYSGKRRK